MSFYGLGFGNFKIGYQTGNDVYTRQLPIFTQLWRSFINGQQEKWVSISNNEYNLYKTTPELFITINKKATMFSNGIFVVKDKNGKVLENDPILSLLENPHPLYDRNRYLMSVMVDMCVFGNHIDYLKKNFETRVLPDAIVPLPTSEISIKETGKQFEALTIGEIIEAYKFNTLQKTYTPEQIMHMKSSSEDGILGISPFHSLQMPISNIRGAYGFRNVNITQNGGLGLISPEKMSDAFGGNMLSDDHRKNIQDQFVEDNGVFDGQSRYKFSQVPVKYEPLNYPIKDSMLFEEISEDWMKIIDAFGLNRNIFSFKDGSKYSNLIEGLRMAYQDSIIPFAEQFCYLLTTKLCDNGKYIELDYSHIPALSDNEKEKAMINKMKSESLKVLIENGLTLQEARTVIGI